MRWALALVVPLAACGSTVDEERNDPTKYPPDAPESWTPIDASVLPAACGLRLEAGAPPVRASSLRKSACDFGETRDSTHYDLNCAPNEPCSPPQKGDGLCHRICDADATCASGETCETRTVYVSDTPSRTAKLCMCAGGECAEKAPAPSTPEGGLDAWRAEAPLPWDTYYHASAASDRHLFVAGGLKFRERSPSGGGSLDGVSAILVADLDSNGTVTSWREAGQLPAAMTHHAMAVLGDRLYVSGGAELGGRKESDALFSYPIHADGSLGELREEAKLPKPRVWHVMLVDAEQSRLVVAAGSHDGAYFADGTPEVSYAAVDPDTGVVGTWGTITFSAPLYYDHGAGIAAGNLYGFVAGSYTDRSTRALWGIPLRDVGPATTTQHFVRNLAWPFDPTDLDAHNENIRLAGTCDALVRVGEHGAVATAAVDGAGHVGVFRAGARFEGNSGGFSLAASPSGRVYAIGGHADTSEQGAIVRSTRRR